MKLHRIASSSKSPFHSFIFPESMFIDSNQICSTPPELHFQAPISLSSPDQLTMVYRHFKTTSFLTMSNLHHSSSAATLILAEEAIVSNLNLARVTLVAFLSSSFLSFIIIDSQNPIDSRYRHCCCSLAFSPTIHSIYLQSSIIEPQ
jgi:hypothetical protein